ncbi:CpaF family protein [Candidatus Micrarchaeota archaeon]|nr:CpaF family protein [Candidatus Micrarchaeota archaeon]
MLGWRILKEGDYTVDLPQISSDEEELIERAQESFKEAARFRSVNSRDESASLIREIVIKISEKEQVALDHDQLEYLSKVALLHIYGFAFIDKLLEDEEIEEISIIGPQRPAYVYLRNKGWKKVNAAFVDEKCIADVINKMARNLGRHITVQNPRLDAMLPNGSRLHASLPPISVGEITIRKFRSNPFSPAELAQSGIVSSDALAMLSLLMQSDSSVIIGGNTASGKTTTLNALFSFIPYNERILISEETPEINIPHDHQLRLVANKDLGISLKDLVYDSLRMRPDRMIVGEVRNKQEVEALFDVLMAGQARGSYATFHAQSVNEALGRIESFGISKSDRASMDCIVIQRRMLVYEPAKKKNIEVRRIIEIAEISENGTPKIIYKDGTLAKNAFVEKLSQKLGIKEKQLQQEMQKRKKTILSGNFGKSAALAGKGDYDSFYRMVQKEFYGADFND